MPHVSWDVKNQARVHLSLNQRERAVRWGLTFEPGVTPAGAKPDIVIDYAKRRMLIAACRETESLAATMPATHLADSLAAKLDHVTASGGTQEPVSLGESLSHYVELLQARMDGAIKPIATGFADLDKRLDGGIERGTDYFDRHRVENGPR